MGRFASVVLVVMLVMMTTEIGPMVGEARTCQSQSHRFKGPCASDTNCASICHTEGFTGGDCKGFRRRCFCTRHC
ncbi:hypothetical protein ACS0TY_024166 [Phlomoides rotata]